MFSRLPREFWLLISILLVGLTVHAIETSGQVHLQSNFLRTLNLAPLAKDIAILGIFAMGAGIIIIAGGIDLSAGSVICFTGVICAKVPDWLGHERGTPYGAALIASMVAITFGVGALVGLLHGGLINNLGLPPFVATLGTMAGLRSLASVIGEGSIAVSDENFRAIGKSWYVPVIIVLIEAVILAVLMRYTRLGRHIYAMGGNEEAARLSGLPIGRLKLFAYGLGSLTATLAGLVYLAHVGSAGSNTAIGYELSGIAAAVVGGCSLKGGSGTILGILLGCVLLRLVINGTLFVITNGATDWEGLIVGVVVILAVLLGRLGGKEPS